MIVSDSVCHSCLFLVSDYVWDSILPIYVVSRLDVRHSYKRFDREDCCSYTHLRRVFVFLLLHSLLGSKQMCRLSKENLMQDAARKALEAALGEKKDAFSKWDEEIKKREESGGGGGGRGRGWGSGGGGGGGGGGDSSGGGLPAMPSNSWDEAKQMVMAFLGLTALVSSTSTLIRI